LVVVLIFVPCFGQLFPKELPFLFAFRPYAGNWRMGWVVVKKTAVDKLKRLKTWDSVLMPENAELLMGAEPDTCEQLDYFTTANIALYPHMRPVVACVEQLQKMQGWLHFSFVYRVFYPLFPN
jgi:hypothetical protein